MNFIVELSTQLFDVDTGLPVDSMDAYKVDVFIYCTDKWGIRFDLFCLRTILLIFFL